MSNFHLEEIKHHHIIENPIYRKLCIWEVLWLLFGISKPKEYDKVCKAEVARMPRNMCWLRSRVRDRMD